MISEWKTWGQIEEEGLPECEFDDIYYDALIQELVQHHWIICGDTHQMMCIPVFIDGYLMLSMRKWAEIMSEAYACMYPCKQGDMLPSMAFYMATTCPIKENLPWEPEDL